MKKISVLIEKIKTVNIIGDITKEVKGIDSDSRNIKSEYMFIAVKGTTVDGHRFIEKAIELGATAIVCEDMPETLKEGITYIAVNDSQLALGQLASAWYNYPSS